MAEPHLRDPDAPLISRLAAEVLLGLVFLGFGAAVLSGALEHEIGWGSGGPQAGYFPFWLGLLIVLGSLVVLAQAVAARGTLRYDVFLTRGAAANVAAFGVPMVLLVPLTLAVGLYVAMALYLVAVLRWRRAHGIGTALAIAAAAPIFCFVVFEQWFQVPLPKGPLEEWLGIH